METERGEEQISMGGNPGMRNPLEAVVGGGGGGAGSGREMNPHNVWFWKLEGLTFVSSYNQRDLIPESLKISRLIRNPGGREEMEIAQ